jgi:hypothetical protein
VIQALLAALLLPLGAFVSLTQLHERWVPIELLGAAVCIVFLEISIRLEARKPEPYRTPLQRTWAFDRRQIWLTFALLSVCWAVLLWTLFLNGGVHQVRPLHAHFMVFATGWLLGVLLWLPLNIRKLAST